MPLEMFYFVSVESLWTVARSSSHRQPWPSWMSSLQKLNCVASSRSSPVYMRAEWCLIASSFRFQRGGLWSCLCIYLPSLGNASLSLTIPLHPSAWRPFFFQSQSSISSPSLSESTAHNPWCEYFCLFYVFFFLVFHASPRPLS